MEHSPLDLRLNRNGRLFAIFESHAGDLGCSFMQATEISRSAGPDGDVILVRDIGDEVVAGAEEVVC